MKNNSTNQLECKPLKSKKVAARFDEPQISSDAGVMFLREVEQRIGVIGRLTRW